MPNLTYAAASGQLGAYLAVPRGTGPWPGVVVIMDAVGLSDDIRNQADRLAAEGYIAFAPDLYSGRGLKCVLATLQASRNGKGQAYDDIEAAVKWLTSRDDCTGKIGTIGFCMGGGFALLIAPRYGIAASAPCYGEVPKPAAEKLAGSCPIVASYGKRDRTLSGRAARLEEALTELGVAHDVKEYPDAGHSFMNRINTGPLITPIQRFVGFDYHQPSAEDAWKRILDFFETHLA
jgi:carboxymethylenebutenolidase